MSELSIRKCLREDIPVFTYIISKTFDDKFRIFFKNTPEEDYTRLAIKLNLLAFDRFGNDSKYILIVDNQTVGAIELYWKRKKEIPLGMTISVLLKKYRLLKALKVGLMLLGFGPPMLIPNKTLHIDKVGVLNAHRRKGYGKRLLNFAFDFAENQNFDYVELNVIEMNKGAIRLYEEMGFTIINTISIPLGRIFANISRYHRMIKPIRKGR